MQCSHRVKFYHIKQIRSQMFFFLGRMVLNRINTNRSFVLPSACSHSCILTLILGPYQKKNSKLASRWKFFFCTAWVISEWWTARVMGTSEKRHTEQMQPASKVHSQKAVFSLLHGAAGINYIMLRDGYIHLTKGHLASSWSIFMLSDLFLQSTQICVNRKQILIQSFDAFGHCLLMKFPMLNTFVSHSFWYLPWYQCQMPSFKRLQPLKTFIFIVCIHPV